MYKSKLEKLLKKKCEAIILIIEKKCLPLADNSESKVFWLKLIGDFYRYQAEVCLLEKEPEYDLDSASLKRNPQMIH